jgi:putative membrane protein
MHILNLRVLMSLCNTLTIFFLIRGLMAIKKGDTKLHRKMMAFGIYTSAVLVIFYLLEAYLHGPIRHENPMGLFKFILITHIFLAVIIPFLVLRTAYLALKGNFEIHKKWAKITLPIWIYVSATGIIIYLT